MRERSAAAESGGDCQSRASGWVTWEALRCAYDALGLDVAADGDEVIHQVVVTLIIEPTNKEDSVWVIDEVGIKLPSITRSSAGFQPTPSRSGARPCRADS